MSKKKSKKAVLAQAADSEAQGATLEPVEETADTGTEQPVEGAATGEADTGQEAPRVQSILRGGNVLETPELRTITLEATRTASEDDGSIKVDDLDVVPIGRQGENLTTEIVIDVSAWLEELPGATILLVALRPGEDELYTPTEVATDDGKTTWQITDVDTALAGNGRAELRAMLNGKLKKSAVFKTEIIRSLMGNGEPAQPTAPDWAQRLEGDAATAAAAATAAQASATAAAASATTAQQQATAAATNTQGLRGFAFSIGEDGGLDLVYTDDE